MWASASDGAPGARGAGAVVALWARSRDRGLRRRRLQLEA